VCVVMQGRCQPRCDFASLVRRSVVYALCRDVVFHVVDASRTCSVVFDLSTDMNGRHGCTSNIHRTFNVSTINLSLLMNVDFRVSTDTGSCSVVTLRVQGQYPTGEIVFELEVDLTPRERLHRCVTIASTRCSFDAISNLPLLRALVSSRIRGWFAGQGVFVQAACGGVACAILSSDDRVDFYGAVSSREMISRVAELEMDTTEQTRWHIISSHRSPSCMNAAFVFQRTQITSAVSRNALIGYAAKAAQAAVEQSEQDVQSLIVGDAELAIALRVKCGLARRCAEGWLIDDLARTVFHDADWRDDY